MAIEKVMAAVQADPQLKADLTAATTREQRVAILQAAGVEVPKGTHNAELAAVNGSGNTMVHTPFSYNITYTTAAIVAMD